MTARERAIELVGKTPLHWQMTPDGQMPDLAENGNEVIRTVEAAILEEQAVYDDLKEDYIKLLGIARELAAKHLRGNVCTYCGSVYNAEGSMAHNPGCKVKELRNYS